MIEQSHTSLPYRLNVGIILVNAHGKVFIGRRLDGNDGWQMPQGGIDEGENPLTAAYRELAEETGTDKANLIHESEKWYTYDLPPELIGRLWRGRYRGQTQKWFVMQFTGQDSDINLETQHREFIEWRWSDVDVLPALVVPFKRPLYQEMLADLSSYIEQAAH